MKVPKGASQLDLTVFAPGFLLTRMRVAFAPSQPLTIPLEQEGGGTVELVIERPIDPFNSDEPWPFLAQDGGVEHDLGTLQDWASMNGSRLETGVLRVPGMPAGNYSLCVRVRGKEGTAAPGVPPKCSAGFLTPAGSLRLDLGSASSSE
ncbi:MAG: hypothetical protein HC897_10925 [Thermoanaerobaculia bacterium]|nr:hypothetical protein [Thermoanaerobaculia bacterium]